MYLFHLPVAQLLAAEIPWPAGFWASRAIILVGTPVIIFVIAEFTERQKDIWRRGLSALGSATYAVVPRAGVPTSM
jgi:hypothetical protein